MLARTGYARNKVEIDLTLHPATHSFSCRYTLTALVTAAGLVLNTNRGFHLDSVMGALRYACTFMLAIRSRTPFFSWQCLRSRSLSIYLNQLTCMRTNGETNLAQLLRTMQPALQPGTYVFCTVQSLAGLDLADVVCLFKEQEGLTVILPQSTADDLGLPYSFVAAWITLTVHSALEAVGLTAAFAQALARANVSCNVVAAYYHDHIFVAASDADKAMHLLQQLAETEERNTKDGSGTLT